MELILLGNSNVGKTTFFNCLTQSDEHTGNWAGVTIDALKRQSVGLRQNVFVTDLPGIYSLNCYSMEEKTAYRYLTEHRAQRVLNLTEASRLNRNLYLTLQVLEMGLTVAVGINMTEELRRNGGKIDCKKLSHVLGVPVFAVDARERTEVLHAAE